MDVPQNLYTRRKRLGHTHFPGREDAASALTACEEARCSGAARENLMHSQHAPHDGKNEQPAVVPVLAVVPVRVSVLAGA